MKNPEPPVSTKTVAGGVGVLAITAIGLATALIGPWEGKRNDPYKDIVGVWTVCYGETRIDMRRYSDAECSALLEKAVEKDFAPAVYRCTPALKNRPYEAAAAISLAYNVGTGAYCRSTADRRFDAGDFKGGCNAFRSWVFAGGKRVQGLTNRREAEIKLCLKGSQ